MYGLPELGEYGDYVAFAEVVGEGADVDVGCVSVVGVPGGFRGTREGVGRLVYMDILGNYGCESLEGDLHCVFELTFV
jgi:hypothetical protein